MKLDSPASNVQDFEALRQRNLQLQEQIQQARSLSALFLASSRLHRYALGERPWSVLRPRRHARLWHRWLPTRRACALRCRLKRRR